MTHLVVFLQELDGSFERAVHSCLNLGLALQDVKEGQ